MGWGDHNITSLKTLKHFPKQGHWPTQLSRWAVANQDVKTINTRFWRRLLKLSWCQKQVRGHVVVTAAAISRCERNKTVCYCSTLMGSVWELSSKGNCHLPGNRQQESFQNIPNSACTPLTYRNFSLKTQQQQACSHIVLCTTALMTSYSRVKS